MDYCSYRYPSQRRVTFANNGMVATSQQLAAQAGLDMLKKGGNAVDAAIATAACLTVVEPSSNGIGGDAFAQVWHKGRLYALNSSGFCPRLLNADLLRRAGYSSVPKLGLCSVTVPGLPAAWAVLSARFGKLPMTELLAPAISYAENGFAVSPTVAEKWRDAAEKTYAPYKNDAEYAEWFRVFTKGGKTPEVGEIYTLPDHAKTLREIAKTNSESFYHGALADEIDSYMKKAGGFLRKDDLEAFGPEWVQPLTVNYKGYDIWELPPNGQGIIALMALNILSGLELPSPDDPRSWHMQIEAIKLAAADAYKYVSDPKFGLQYTPEQLLDISYAAKRRSLIGERALLPEPGRPIGGGTVYLCTADGEGGMVSYIQSNFYGFGSGIVVPGTGIALQSRGGAFDLSPDSRNCLAPGKRPYHTIIPGFITKGSEAVGPFGVMGAFMQPQGHLQLLLKVIEYQMNPQSAIDAPRWQWTEGKTVQLEQSVAPHIADALKAMGHDVRYLSDRSPFGRAQMIMRTQYGTLAGGTDPRCDGAVVSF